LGRRSPGRVDDVAFDVVVAVRHHGAVQAEQQPSTGSAALSWPRISSRIVS
jgi:hypothetical protein